MTILSSFGFRLTSPFFLTTFLAQTTTLPQPTGILFLRSPTSTFHYIATMSSDNNDNNNNNNNNHIRGSIPESSKEALPVPRYNGPSLEEMTDQQKDIREAILKSRPRTGLNGPFGPWLSVPEIAAPASTLGKSCRYDTSLSFRESELVILLTGAKTRSATEFGIHTDEAIKAGLTMEVISAIPRDDDFSLQTVKDQLIPLLDNDREKYIVHFAAELLDSCTVSDETYSSTKAAVENKDSVLVEITSIVGYYTLVSYTLNVFNIPPK
jgi:4-carboxymuconolactone decarboxylase